MRNINIAYIGGGSKMWARVFMSDLALSENLGGQIRLYDIDTVAAQRNAKIGKYINENPKTLSKFDYIVCDNLKDALVGCDFVILSILPGTFDEMESDVHEPEKYGIYQTVGDTVGPGGILRSMRTVPLYEGFAKAIKEYCPNSWVINFTNPMTICTKTLYDVFPEIKAFGCCHEVFNAQDFLTCVLKEECNLNVTRKDIFTDACGVNHFTWISDARYKDIDILSKIDSFMEKFYDEGYYEHGDRFQFKTNPFSYGNKVKMDLFKRYGVLAAAGDRHLVEFLNNKWYLENKDVIKSWCVNLTTVDYRRNEQRQRIEETILMAEGKKEFELVKSNEEAVDLMKAILGEKTIVSNVNFPNKGQLIGAKLGAIVETNCVFTHNSVKPIVSKKLPDDVLNLVNRNIMNIESCYEGIKERNLQKIFNSFVNQPLCSNLNYDDAKALFKKMCLNTQNYLKDFYDLSMLDNIR